MCARLARSHMSTHTHLFSASPALKAVAWYSAPNERLRPLAELFFVATHVELDGAYVAILVVQLYREALHDPEMAFVHSSNYDYGRCDGSWYATF